MSGDSAETEKIDPNSEADGYNDTFESSYQQILDERVTTHPSDQQ